MPLAPLGCAVQIFESRDRRGMWAEHITNGCYIGTSNEHYQCYKIYVKKTRSVRISDTVFFKHKHITQPTLTQMDAIFKAINDLIHALKGRKNLKGIAQIEALEKLMKSSTTCQKQWKQTQQLEQHPQHCRTYHNNHQQKQS